VTSGVGNPCVTSQANVTESCSSATIIPLSGIGRMSGLTAKKEKFYHFIESLFEKNINKPLHLFIQVSKCKETTSQQEVLMKSTKRKEK
jgi:hypothetical protein